MCYTMIVQRFEPQGRRFTNFYYYYIRWYRRPFRLIYRYKKLFSPLCAVHRERQSAETAVELEVLWRRKAQTKRPHSRPVQPDDRLRCSGTQGPQSHLQVHRSTERLATRRGRSGHHLHRSQLQGVPRLSRNRLRYVKKTLVVFKASAVLRFHRPTL